MNAERKKRTSRAMRMLRHSPMTLTGATIVATFTFIALFAPYISPYPGDATGREASLENKLRPPSKSHLLGTDDLGRDVMSRLFAGTRLSLGLGAAVVVITATLGVVFGCIAGYFGGRVDEIIMRIGDTFMAIPKILLVIALVIATGRGLGKLVFAIAVPWWPWYARVIRGEVMRIREMYFVRAARALGTSPFRIIFLHILPNVMSVVMVQASLQFGRAVLAIAAMGFLGLGVQPPLVEWGQMVSIGRAYMPTWWWNASFPGAAIFLLGLGFNLLGDGLRDVLDPRSASRQ